MAITKSRLQAINTADAFRARFGNDSIYAFIGRVTPYASSSSGSPLETRAEDIETWDGIYALKKITLADVSHVLPVTTWSSGTYYDMYEHDVEMATADSTLSYFVTPTTGSDMAVYKCINDGSFGVCTGDQSTVDPMPSVGTSTTIPDNLADNYRWKFMYVISDYTDNKFYDGTWTPVSRTGGEGSLQASVAAAGVDGAIEHIKVTAVGSGYTSVPTVTITGDGSGATAIAIVKGLTASSSSAMGSSSSSGFECADTSSSSSSAALSSSSSSAAPSCTEEDNTVIEIIIINGGSGYTNAEVTLSGGGGSGAAAKAIISPKWGHGYDPVNELAANSIMVVADFDGTEQDRIAADADFHQIGLVVNPTTYGSKTIATGDVYDQTVTLNIDDSGSGLTSGTYTEDTVITGDSSGATGLVVEWTATTASAGVLKLANVDGTFESAESINSTPAHTITTITNPDLEPGSGEIIMIDNISTVTRDPAQRDRIRFVLTF
jgi:hypothetical protein